MVVVGNKYLQPIRISVFTKNSINAPTLHRYLSPSALFSFSHPLPVFFLLIAFQQRYYLKGGLLFLILPHHPPIFVKLSLFYLWKPCDSPWKRQHSVEQPFRSDTTSFGLGFGSIEMLRCLSRELACRRSFMKFDTWCKTLAWELERGNME